MRATRKITPSVTPTVSHHSELNRAGSDCCARTKNMRPIQLGETEPVKSCRRRAKRTAPDGRETGTGDLRRLVGLLQYHDRSKMFKMEVADTHYAITPDGVY